MLALTLTITLLIIGGLATFIHFTAKKRKSPDTTLAINDIVQTLMAQFKVESKSEHFRALTDAVTALTPLDVHNADANNYALQQLKQGNTEPAKQLFTNWLEHQTAPDSAAKAARHLGALAHLNSTTAAFNAYRQAVKLDPNNPDGWSQLGHVLKSIGEFDKAQNAYEKVLNWAEIHKNDEYRAIAYNHLGILYWTSGDIQSSEDMHLHSLAINQTLGRKKGMAKQYGNLGILYRVRGELQKAEQMFLKAIEIDQDIDRHEDLARQYGNLGNLYNAMGNMQKAEEMFRHSLQIDQSLKGREGRKTDLQLAELMYLKSLEISQNLRCKECMASDYSHLGHFYSTHGNLQQAEQMHLKSLEIETALKHQEGMAEQYSELGMVYQTRGDLAKAEEMYFKSLAIETELGRKAGMANQYDHLGIIYNARSELPKAEEMFLKALEFDKALGRQEEVANHYANLGTVYRKGGNLEQAKELYLKSYQLYRALGRSNRADLVQQWLVKLENE
jgi:tetratricopeptide (TPR) repeat protein